MNSRRYYDKYKRDPEARAFYKGKAWSRARELALLRDNNLCQECLRRGKVTPADMVHHIKELKDYPELKLNLDNLESLCNSCHNKEHPDRGSKEDKKVSKKIKIIKSKKNPEIF